MVAGAEIDFFWCTQSIGTKERETTHNLARSIHLNMHDQAEHQQHAGLPMQPLTNVVGMYESRQ